MATLLSYALCSLEDVKESLGIDAGDTSRDNLIIRKINQATQVIEGWCMLAYGHHFKETTYTDEEYTGSGINQLSLLMRPVTSISSFQYRGTSQNEDNWDSVETEDYFSNLSTGTINLLSSQGTSFGSVRVTYTAGYAVIPAALAEACATLAAYLVENGASGSVVKSKQEGQRKVEYFSPSGSDNAGGGSIIEQLGLDDMLQPYVNMSMVDV